MYMPPSSFFKLKNLKLYSLEESGYGMLSRRLASARLSVPNQGDTPPHPTLPHPQLGMLFNLPHLTPSRLCIQLLHSAAHSSLSTVHQTPALHPTLRGPILVHILHALFREAVMRFG